MAEFATRGVGNAALTTGIIGTAGWALNGGLSNLLGGIMGGNGCNNGWNNGCNGGFVPMCNENMPVNRYELAQESKIADLQSQIALRDANTYGDQKMLELYKYFDGQLKDVRETLCHQAVHNQRTEDSFVLARQDIAAVKSELMGAIEREAERRCCADNSIVGYVNATFYPKLVADVTAAATTTAQTLYNPIPKCGCCNGG